MIVNAPIPQLFSRHHTQQRQDSFARNSFMRPNDNNQAQTLQQPAESFSRVAGLQCPLGANQVHQAKQQQQQIFRLDEDASEVLNFTLNGGPKWGFRIRLLNDNRVIVSRVDKGPAEKCGLKVNDELLSVNNVPLGDKPQSLLIHDRPDQNSGPDNADKIPLLAESNQANLRDPLFASAQGLAPLELSKLDFAYQLIKHSSVANKLMLTVRRYLNPAYARASVAATSAQARDKTQDEQEADWPKTKRWHTLAGVHYAYKCCECYCDNEGK